jgi:hypothetical protein
MLVIGTAVAGCGVPLPPSAPKSEAPKSSAPANETSAPKKASLHLGTLAVSGKLEAKVVADHIEKEGFPRLAECYATSLATNPKLEGRVLAKLVIVATGYVSHVQDEGSDIGDPHLMACAMHELLKMSFPKPAQTFGAPLEEVFVDVPIFFSPP